MKKNYKSNLILILLLILLTLCLLNSNLITKNILEYTNLFVTKLFPSSFLIYTLSSLLINFEIIETLFKRFKKPASTYIILMSMISGFPSGPKYINELHKNNYLTKKEANRLLTFCHFPNPIFVLGPISQLLNFSISLKILISLIISNLIIAILTKNKEKQSLPPTKNLTFSKALSNSINRSLKLQSLIYGTNIFFYIISVIITSYITTSPIVYVIINSFFDLIKGIFSTSLLSSSLMKAVIIIISLSLGSISINIQIKSILSDTSLSYKSFLKGRLISTILSLFIFYILY